LAASLLATLAYAGVFVTGQANAGATTEHFTIGSDVNDMETPFLAALATGEQAEAKKLGMTVKVLSANSAGSISLSQEISNIESFISEKVSVILVTPSNSTAILPVIKKANAAGIPVIAVNEPVGVVTGHHVNTSGAKVVTYIGDDDTAYGVAEANLVVKAIHGKGNIVMIHGILGASADTYRFNGMRSVFSKYPGIKVVSTMVDNWTNTTNVTDVQDLLAKYPGKDLAAVVSVGPEMYAGAEYARSHGNKTIQFIAGDYSVQVSAAIKNGALYGTVDQSPGLEGQLGVQYAYDWLTNHKSLVPSPVSDIPLPLVTKANVNSVKALWSS
jgi:ribose transport system substrate-binding protein